MVCSPEKPRSRALLDTVAAHLVELVEGLSRLTSWSAAPMAAAMAPRYSVHADGEVGSPSAVSASWTTAMHSASAMGESVPMVSTSHW